MCCAMVRWRKGSILLDGGELVMTQSGFGLFESRRLRWFGKEDAPLGTILSAESIRRIYSPKEAGSGKPAAAPTIDAPPRWWE